jgi:hypothetical protein
LSYYLYSKKLTRDILGEETRKLKYLKTLIDKTKELDKSILENFPISFFGNENDDLRIKGVRALIEGFDEIDSEKMDIIAQYKDIQYVGIDDKKQILLNFNCDDETIVTHSLYDFYNDFLEEGFQLVKYIDYCIKNDYYDIIKKNLEWLFSRNGDAEAKQYRLLRDIDGTWGVRGKTSNGYKNYDNNVALYLSLLALHKYSIEKDKYYHINSAYVTDSSLYIFFEHDEPVHIPEVGDVYLGLAISNGEIRNYKFQAEMRYRIVSDKNDVSFSAISSSSVFSIIHNMNVSTINKQLEKLFRLDTLEDEMLDFIKALNNSENLSEDSMYFLVTDLLEKLKKCSDISTKTRDEFKKVEISNMILGTYTLVDFFGKLKMIPTDVDEQIFIERIFHKVISDLQVKKNN